MQTTAKKKNPGEQIAVGLQTVVVLLLLLLLFVGVVSGSDTCFHNFQRPWGKHADGAQTDRQRDREFTLGANKLFLLLRAMTLSKFHLHESAIMLIISHEKFFHFINLTRKKRRAEERNFASFFFALKSPHNHENTNPFRCSKSSEPSYNNETLFFFFGHAVVQKLLSLLIGVHIFYRVRE